MRSLVTFREVIRHIGATRIVLTTLVFLLTVSATCAGGYFLYKNTKESILLQGEVNATRAAKEFDSYLIVRENAVLMCGEVVNDMINKGQPNSDVLEFLETETFSVKGAIDKDYTGLYGWIRGEYLDGAGWVPEDDYVPTERPWYTESMADKGKDSITFIKPYMDQQTLTIATTIAMKMVDGTSVMALDISLDRIQEITEEIAEQTQGSIGLVLDESGTVIAHSDREEVGKNFLEEDDSLGAALANKVCNNDQKQFQLNYNNKSYIVYAEDIEGGWKSVSMVDTKMFYRPLNIIMSLIFLFTLMEMVVFGAILYNLSSKNLAISIQNIQLSAVADLYLSIYDIDMPKDAIREIRRNREGGERNLTKVRGGAQGSAREALQSLLENGVDEVSLSIMEPFLDYETLKERLEDTNTIAEEYQDDHKLWCRSRFVVAERDSDGQADRVLWMIESIDEERKHRERLKILSETDRMTGLLNRSAGESKIQDLLNLGGGGMMVMIDLDKFKTINDSLGHDVGDKVILAAAKAVRSAFRSSDIVMRLGGDEFVAYAPGVVDREVGSNILERMFRDLSNTVVAEMGEHRVHGSAGVSFCPKGEVMAFADLYKQADLSVYESKKKSGNSYTFYSEKMTAGE